MAINTPRARENITVNTDLLGTRSFHLSSVLLASWTLFSTYELHNLEMCFFTTYMKSAGKLTVGAVVVACKPTCQIISTTVPTKITQLLHLDRSFWSLPCADELMSLLNISTSSPLFVFIQSKLITVPKLVHCKPLQNYIGWRPD